MSQAGALRDFRPAEYALAALASFAIMGGAIVALRAVALEERAAAPEIEKGISVPVRVIPVLDMDTPLLKLGGKRNKLKLPDRWVRQTPKPRVAERAFVSTKAGKSEKDIPPEEVKIADAGTPITPPDASLAKEVDTPIEEPIDAGPPANVDQEGHEDGVKEGTETDPLKARAVDLYRNKIAGWFSSRFRVSGSGLSQEEIVKIRVGASVQISGDRSVASFTISPSGNAAFDAAARAALEGAKGQQLPPPPENYPDILQSQIQLTFRCRENQCD